MCGMNVHCHDSTKCLQGIKGVTAGHQRTVKSWSEIRWLVIKVLAGFRLTCGSMETFPAYSELIETEWPTARAWLEHLWNRLQEMQLEKGRMQVFLEEFYLM